MIAYRGDQPNGELNGLLLWVDIQRLLDAYLVSIYPDNLLFEAFVSLGDHYKKFKRQKYKRISNREKSGANSESPKRRTVWRLRLNNVL